MGVRVPDSPAVYDHLRLAETDTVPAVEATPGVYRVVGTEETTVTLLRVADVEGRRANTGELLTVERDALGTFEPTDNPDGNRSLAAAFAGQLDGLVWQLRTFGRSLAARPALSVVALAVLLVGATGERFLSGPEWAFTAAVFAGSLGVAVIGSNLV